MAKPERVPENLLSVLPPEVSEALFAAARPHRLKADQTLFIAGDPGDGCYRVEQGLLKVSMLSPSGGERILAILVYSAVVRREYIDQLGPSFKAGGCTEMSSLISWAFRGSGQTRIRTRCRAACASGP